MIAVTLQAMASQVWTAELTRVLTGSMIAAVWQGILLSLLVALGLRLLPNTPAGVRFAIWFGLFVVVAALPSARLVHRGSVAGPDAHTAWFILDEHWCLIVAGAWTIASLIRAASLLLAVLRVRTLWKRATPFEFVREQMSSAINSTAVATPHEKATVRDAQICLSGDIDRPTVIGVFSPRILIPAWLAEKLSSNELEQIVLHEAGHLSRADDWLNLLQKLALVVFPLNPALVWVERRLCFERELACDERVLQTTCAPKAYAACLASLAEHRLGRQGLALALGVLGRESQLGSRVARILCRKERMRPIHARLVLCAAMFGLLAATVALQHSPQVVGFAPAGEAAALTHPLRSYDAMQSAYQYQPVVYRSANTYGHELHSYNAPMSPLQTMSNADRKRKLTRRLPESNVLLAATDDAGLQAGLMLPSASYMVAAEARPEHRQEVSDSNVALQGGRLQNVGADAGVQSIVQWVVVTSWGGGDGSRMVLTTVRTDSPASIAAGGSDAEKIQLPLDQVHPYAALPVRDGWLVFQL